MKKLAIFSLTALVLAGCNLQAQMGQSKIDQSKLCIYSTDEVAAKCKPGELSWFAPSSWGNEQSPLIVAAAYCDFNYQVMYNNSGVICVFTDKRLSIVN